MEHRPCRVRLRDGSWRDGVYVEDLETSISMSGVSITRWTRGVIGNFPLPMLSRLRTVHDGFLRRSANALYDAGKSAMGMLLRVRGGIRTDASPLDRKLRGLRRLASRRPADIVRVEPHADEARTSPTPARTLDIRWSIYALSGTEP